MGHGLEGRHRAWRTSHNFLALEIGDGVDIGVGDVSENGAAGESRAV